MYINVEVLNLYIDAMLSIFAILEYSGTRVHYLMDLEYYNTCIMIYLFFLSWLLLSFRFSLILVIMLFRIRSCSIISTLSIDIWLAKYRENVLQYSPNTPNFVDFATISSELFSAMPKFRVLRHCQRV